MKQEAKAIQATKYWLLKTVIGFNFCPFAKRELIRNSIDYQVSDTLQTEDALYQLMEVFKRLDHHKTIETSLLIFERGFAKFEDYLDLLDYANQLLEQEDYTGIYQIASFHPNYIFDGVDQDDASNYTNRSPYPILHILREASLEKALQHLENPEEIPERNISLAQEKGTRVFEKVLEKAFHQ
ncbi:DUF1415 domain-containing protein [Kangiella sp. TOML190]|uniref:DUF1415 domain-containing protein n=1 Tax=Kangiella sp. TOML190 TaxID=2931351 RepID=UPI0020409384|nr:DUF1415 domain-containing protein [Kangiella sp. TOML190]